LNLIDEYIVHLPVRNEIGTNVIVEFDWIDEVCGYRMLKINFNDMIGLYTVFKKVIFEYIEKKITLSAASDTGKNFYETVVFCFTITSI
jgi:hypothetical protein